MHSVENKLVVDSLWDWKERSELNEKLKGAGYRELGTGIFVPEEDAYNYALERISQIESEKREFVNWFYSGNWIKEGSDGTD